eukprot:9125955-Pyramimonas_sp.AAC.1
MGAEHVVQDTLHGQSEDVRDLQSEGDISHSIEKNEEYAQFHTSPGPSRHLEPLFDMRVGLAPDRVRIEASHKKILDSDDDFKDGESPNQAHWQSRYRATPTQCVQ